MVHHKGAEKMIAIILAFGVVAPLYGQCALKIKVLNIFITFLQIIAKGKVDARDRPTRAPLSNLCLYGAF